MKQTGRSMIEMLGVLAIIGILSIVGIAMYRRAVNNHHANTILDDANRLAFVITESNRSFEPYDNITGLEYAKTSTYFLNAFTEATSQQLAIMVTNVPKGVCEPLIDKAHIEYKVRVLPAESAQYPEQVSVYGELYDEQNTDICNDMNDVVLFFGDTSGQYNPTGEEECNSYADCPHGSFCVFTHPTETDKIGNGPGECQKVLSYEPETKTMSDGNTWTRSKNNMNWWSALDWCQAQRKTPVTWADVGPSCVLYQPCSSTIMAAIVTEWQPPNDEIGDRYWLNNEDLTVRKAARRILLYAVDTGKSNVVNDTWKNTHMTRAFCH